MLNFPSIHSHKNAFQLKSESTTLNSHFYSSVQLIFTRVPIFLLLQNNIHPYSIYNMHKILVQSFKTPTVLFSKFPWNPLLFPKSKIFQETFLSPFECSPHPSLVWPYKFANWLRGNSASNSYQYCLLVTPPILFPPPPQPASLCQPTAY